MQVTSKGVFLQNTPTRVIERKMSLESSQKVEKSEKAHLETSPISGLSSLNLNQEKEPKERNQ